jgi:hypothetical protein
MLRIEKTNWVSLFETGWESRAAPALFGGSVCRMISFLGECLAARLRGLFEVCVALSM